jgi:UDP-N-acetyl-D-galactosamine dehydrogenase
MNFTNRTIALIGLGYVGLPLAVEFGKRRHVIGFDINANRIADLKTGYDRTLEVSQDDLASANKLILSNNVDDLYEAQIFIVTVPTPVDKANHPDLAPLIKATVTVGKALKAGDVVIYESTVYPGATEEVCVPILERESGLSYNIDFYIAYSPERINPGDKTHRLQDIKKIVSGSTPEVAEAVDNLYREIITAGTHKATSIKVAEAAKVIENAQRDLNIAFVNELSVIFNRMGIDSAEVLAAAATKWNFLPFKPGLVGGHCIGVDPYYLTYKAQELGYQPQVILSGRRINDSMGRYAAHNVIRIMLNNKFNISEATVGVLGITFKENCPDVRNSKVVDIVYELERWGVQVKVMDPWANPKEVLEEYNLHLTKITPMEPVDSIIVAVAHNDFSKLMPSDLRSMCRFHNGKAVIADLKALYDKKDLEEKGFVVFRF